MSPRAATSQSALARGYDVAPAPVGALHSADQAASVHCEAGSTQLVEILRRSRAHDGVKVLVYIGDVFEESLEAAEEAAAALRLRGTRVIVLHDRSHAPQFDVSGEAFQIIAKITDGAVLPFDPSAVVKLREILEAVATLAVGGTKLLRARRQALLPQRCCSSSSRSRVSRRTRTVTPAGWPRHSP
jgi:hypothetical protein